MLQPILGSTDRDKPIIYDFLALYLLGNYFRSFKMCLLSAIILLVPKIYQKYDFGIFYRVFPTTVLTIGFVPVLTFELNLSIV